MSHLQLRMVENKAKTQRCLWIIFDFAETFKDLIEILSQQVTILPIMKQDGYCYSFVTGLTNDTGFRYHLIQKMRKEQDFALNRKEFFFIWIRL